MNLELPQLLALGTAYFGLLFAIARFTDKGWIPDSIINHPATYVLSLGVFAGAWAIYGIVGMAHYYGYGFLSYYLGIAALFIFSPLLLDPLRRICQNYKQSSLADLLSFRYHSQLTGSLITLFMVIAVCPLLAMQIQAVSESLQILSANGAATNEHKDLLAILFCAGMALLTISFSNKQLTVHQRHNGLVAAIAFESIVKLVAILAAGFVALFTVFEGFDGLEQWLNNNPQTLGLLNHPPHENSSRSYLLIFFAAAVAMPHMFHMIFAENPSVKSIRSASWGVPLLLFLLSLPVLPILWAALKLESDLPLDYSTLALAVELDSSSLALLVFIGGLSAASGMMIVTTLALAPMCIKHLILPIYKPRAELDIYRWIRWARRIIIIFITIAGYLFYHFLADTQALSDFGMTSVIATLQFLPGILAALYWQGANRNGLIWGLIGGFSIWFITLLLPLVSTFNPESTIELLFQFSYSDKWGAIAIISLGFNILLFGIVSLLSSTSDEEKAAAEMCSPDDINRPTRRILSIKNPEQMMKKLSSALGEQMAQREVDRVLNELQINRKETRPFALRRLRNRLEYNLSGLMGPSLANQLVNDLLPYEADSGGENSEDISLIEVRLEKYKSHLTGLAADLDNLRRYHRQTLQDLPVGVCSLGQDREILMWNHSAAKLTQIETAQVTGSYLHMLPAPWGEVLSDFIDKPEPHLYKQRIEINGNSQWINLHKTSIAGIGEQSSKRSDSNESKERVIVIEDATEVQLLEDELLHSQRLASIGGLAAGVAHEIGNPVTGIACLAQNLQYDTDNPESLETGREILRQTDRISKIVQTLVNFAHSGSNNPEHKHQKVFLKPCIDEAIHLLYLNREARTVTFENLCPDSITVLADTQRLLQVFVNLLSNARDASPDDATVRIESDTRDGETLIHVTDHGSGIKEELQDLIFDPFFTTKDPGDGTGLGLSLAYSIINEFDGQITVQSPIDGGDRGTRFTLKLKSQ